MTPHAPISGGTRRRGAAPESVVTAFGVALAVHVLVLLLIRPLVVEVRGNMGHARDGKAELAAAEPLVALDPSCDGDAMLRAAARVVWCATPFVEDATACLDAAAERLRTDEMLCHVDQLDVVPATALLDHQKIEDIPQIDAEPLMEPLTPEEQQRYEQALAAAQPPPPPPPPAAQRPRDTQVVENTETNDEEPEDARFLAEFNSKVDKQTVARADKMDEMVKRPDPAQVPSKKDATKPATQKDTPEDQVGKSKDAPPNPGVFSMRKPGTPDQGEVAQDQKTKGATDGSKAPTGDGSQGKRGDGSISQDERKPSTSDGGEGGGGGGSPRAPNLHPDDETLERIVGGGSVDHVEDVEDGDETNYNAKRWVYATFFNRMKRQVAQNWDPATVWRREDPDGTHYGFKDRVTALRVSLDGKGAMVKVLIVQSSGVDALDDEAIHAFQAAQPFPNPPQALVDADGKITFDFGFYFTIDNGTSTSWKYRGN